MQKKHGADTSKVLCRRIMQLFYICYIQSFSRHLQRCILIQYIDCYGFGYLKTPFYDFSEFIYLFIFSAPLKHVLTPWRKHGGNNHYVSIQDGARAHTSKTTLEYFNRNLAEYIEPSKSSDLNPVDYFIWSRLESNVFIK